LLGYVACIVDIVDGAAAALNSLGHALVSGEAALVPELEGEADEGVTLGAQEGGDGGGVDSSGHGDGDGFGRRHTAVSMIRGAGPAANGGEDERVVGLRGWLTG
jgi:hypothetical protein